MKITQKQIEKTLKTGDRTLLPLFCILMDRQVSSLNEDSLTAYYIITQPNYRNCTEISKQHAMALVKLYGLKPQLKNGDGVVYDTPERKYRQKYRYHEVSL